MRNTAALVGAVPSGHQGEPTLAWPARACRPTPPIALQRHLVGADLVSARDELSHCSPTAPQPPIPPDGLWKSSRDGISRLYVALNALLERWFAAGQRRSWPLRRA